MKDGFPKKDIKTKKNGALDSKKQLIVNQSKDDGLGLFVQSTKISLTSSSSSTRSAD